MKEAVVLLRPLENSAAPNPAISRSIAEAVLRQTSSETGLRPELVNIMDQLHSFTVRAPQTFIDALSQAPQVASIIMNEPSGSAFIEPVRRRRVHLPD